MQEAQVRKLIDIRENRVGQLAGFAKYPDLAFFLQQIAGIAYDYQPIFAPTAEIRDAYIESRDWAKYEIAFAELMTQRQALDKADTEAFEGRVALLCSEAEPGKCHRRLVAEMLAERWTAQGHHIEVEHLASAKPPRKVKPKKARHA